MRYIFVFILLCIASTYTYSTPSKGDKNLEEEVYKLIDEGVNYATNNNYIACNQAYTIALLKLQNVNNPTLKARILNSWGTSLFELNHGEEAYKKYSLARSMEDQITDTVLLSHIYLNLSNSTFELGDPEEAERLEQKALTFINSTSERSRAYQWMNMGVKRFIAERDSADYYLLKAIDLAEKLDDNMLHSNALMNLGNCYLFEEGLEKQALQKYKEAVEIAELVDNTSFQNTIKVRYYASLLRQVENPPMETIIRFTIQLDDDKEWNSLLVIAFSLKEYYSAKGDFESALLYSSLAFDAETNISGERMQNRVENYEHYITELTTRKDSTIAEKELKIQKNKIILFSTLAILLSLLATVILTLSLIKKKNKLTITLKDKIDLLETEKTLKEELSQKEKELLSKEIKLTETNASLNTTMDNLKKLKLSTDGKNSQIEISKMLMDLKQRESSNIWQEFEYRFNQTHPEFYKNLSKTHAKLSVNDLRLAAFIRLNLTTREISDITKQSTNSIDVAKSRLRKKLNIQGKEDLYLFILNI